MNYQLSGFLGKEMMCGCGRVHSTTLKKIDIDEGAVKRLPAMLRELGYHKVYLVADKNTYQAAGAATEAALLGDGIPCEKIVLEDAELVPNEETLGRIFLGYPMDADLILAVGTGTINDLCKYISFKLNRDYIIFASAPSMDGFVSVGAALILNHVKTTLDAHGPVAVVGDTDILAQAPMNMITAGLGDILGKYTCLMDWKLAHIITGEYYCVTVVDMVRDAIETVVSQGKNMKTRDKQAVKALMEALVLTGMAMYFVGNSRPASGCEHHLSHYWEMRFLMEGKKPILHGTKVGIGMVTALRMYHMLLEEPVDFAKALAKEREYGQWEEKMRSCYRTAAEGILQVEKDSGKNELSARNHRLKTIEENWAAIKAAIARDLPPLEEVEQLLVSLEAPVLPEQIGLSLELVEEGIQVAKEVRNRYTLLQLLWDLGLEEKYSREMVAYFGGKK